MLKKKKKITKEVEPIKRTAMLTGRQQNPETLVMLCH